MPISEDEMGHVQSLAEGRLEPANGMEIHFVNVVNANGIACTPKEKEWMAYWVSIKDNIRKADDETAVHTSEVKSDASYIDNITEKIKSNVLEIEHRTDITDDQKIAKITTYACVTCAGIAVQPIPFADIFVLTPIQAYFGTRIASIRGVPVNESETADSIKEIIGVLGMGFIAQQIAIGIWKMVSFGAGGLLTIPLVYALTYAVMKVIDAYYIAKSKKQGLTDEQIKEIFKQGLRDAKMRSKKDL